MTVGQSHIVGTWTLNLSFSKRPLSSSHQVSPASLLIHLSVIPPPIFFFSFSSPRPLSVFFIHLSLVAVIPWPCFFNGLCWYFQLCHGSIICFPLKYKDRSFFTSLSLPCPFKFIGVSCSFMHNPSFPFVIQRVYSCQLVWSSLECTDPLHFIASKLTTTSGLIYLRNINGERKQQKQWWQGTLRLLCAGMWCCDWSPANSHQQSLHKPGHSGPFTNQTAFTLLFFTNYH